MSSCSSLQYGNIMTAIDYDAGDKYTNFEITEDNISQTYGSKSNKCYDNFSINFDKKNQRQKGKLFVRRF